MPLIHDKAVFLLAVGVVFYALPAAIYVFFMLKWRRARKDMFKNRRGDNVEAWWDLVMGPERQAPGGEAQQLSFLAREKQRWFWILVLSWVAATAILLNLIFK